MPPRRRHRHYTFGFWAVALAFVVNMALIAVPTPLYVIYQQRDHFSTITLTIVYAVYAAGVILSLFLGGHLSDWFGRKRVYVPALLLNAASALIFVADPSLPYLVFLVFLVALTALVALSPETGTALVPRPRYRPQRIAVPRAARRTFFAATATSLAAFAVYGIFNSLAPSFLAVTLHQDSHALAGAMAFAVFAAGAAIQIAMSRAGLRATLRVAPLILIPGLALLAVGMWFALLPLFIIGGIVVGAGAALAFRGGLSAAAASAPPRARAEVLSGFFLGTYIGLSVPAVILGIATQYVSPRSAMLVFAVIVVAAAAAAVSTRVLRSER
jgi:MFS family permease